MGGGGDRLWEKFLRKYKDCEEMLILSKSMRVNLASCQVSWGQVLAWSHIKPGGNVFNKKEFIQQKLEDNSNTK